MTECLSFSIIVGCDWQDQGVILFDIDMAVIIDFMHSVDFDGVGIGEGDANCNGLVACSYSELANMSQTASFFAHFSALYPALNWNLYDFECAPQTKQLVMISIPSRHKQAIIDQLAMDNKVSIEKLPGFERNEMLPSGPLLDTEHNILYCSIPKVSCTKFSALFYGINQNISQNLAQFEADNLIHRMIPNGNLRLLDLTKYTKLMSDAEWNKFVVLRDPLHRSLSAYIENVRRAT